MRPLACAAFVLGVACCAAAQSPLIQDIARATGFGVADGAPAAAGRDYKVLLRGDGLAFVPALGDRAPHNLPLDISFGAARCGDWRLDDGRAAQAEVRADRNQVRWTRGPGLTEVLDVSPEGVELSWQLDAAPPSAGDLCVEMHLGTELPLVEQSADGLLFAQAGLGGVRVGRVTGRDAAGREVEGGLQLEPAADGSLLLRLSLPTEFVATARYPLVLDPPIEPWLPVWTGADWPPLALRHDVVAVQPGGVIAFCVWVSDFSSTDHDIVGRELVDPDSTPPQPLLLLEASSSWDDLPEMSCPTFDGWILLAWVRKEGVGYRIRGMLAKPWDPKADEVIGTPGNITGLDASLARPGVNASLFESASPLGDVGCVVYGTTGGMVNLVKVATDTVGPGNTLLIGATATLVAGAPNAQPTLPRSRAIFAPTLVVWRQAGGVHGLMVDMNGTVVKGPKLLKTNLFTPVDQPRVDGAFEDFALVTTEDHPLADLRVTLTYVDNQLAISPDYVCSNHAILPADVAVAQDLKYYGSALRAVATTLTPYPTNGAASTSTFADTPQGTQINQLEWGVGTGVPADAPTITNGDSARTTAAWADASGNVDIQLGSPWSDGGPVLAKGEPCGESGVLQPWWYAPEAALGNFEFTLSVLDASPVASVALLNLGVPVPYMKCGPCLIEPVQLLLPMTPTAVPGDFFFEAPLPADPALGGLSIEAQAIVHTPGAGGCGGMPNWSFTNLLDFTIK